MYARALAKYFKRTKGERFKTTVSVLEYRRLHDEMKFPEILITSARVNEQLE
jgi:hypothetical protein